MRLDPIAIEAGVYLFPLDETASTNAEALSRARMGHPLWVTAVTQTRGRGRHRREWISPPGTTTVIARNSSSYMIDCIMLFLPRIHACNTP